MIRDGDAWCDGESAPWMITLPAGEFAMGASEADKFANDTERPVSVRSIGRFALGRFPVTVAEYRAFRPDHEDAGDAAWPVVMVSWEDAMAYCAWLTQRTPRAYRLPTEAEWEYACRAGTRTPFATGAELTVADANFQYSESGNPIGRGKRTPGGTFAPNAFGLHDLHGNVCEWTADPWNVNHRGAPADGSARPDGEGSCRVIRGGAWDYLPRLLRSSWRDALPVAARRDNLGFRIATGDIAS